MSSSSAGMAGSTAAPAPAKISTDSCSGAEVTAGASAGSTAGLGDPQKAGWSASVGGLAAAGIDSGTPEPAKGSSTSSANGSMFCFGTKENYRLQKIGIHAEHP